MDHGWVVGLSTSEGFAAHYWYATQDEAEAARKELMAGDGIYIPIENDNEVQGDVFVPRSAFACIMCHKYPGGPLEERRVSFVYDMPPPWAIGRMLQVTR